MQKYLLISFIFTTFTAVFVWILSKKWQIICLDFILHNLHNTNIQCIRSGKIDAALLDWAKSSNHKPLLLRGARQVGKSTAIRHLGEHFESFVEINFDKQRSFHTLFNDDLDAHKIASQIANLTGKEVLPGKTLLFFDEIQACPNAILSLRFFAEDYPQLHAIAAGSLLEFALAELPTFGVGRMKSLFPVLLRQVLRSAASQITNKYVYAQASSEKASKVREALELLIMAGLLIPATRTSANGLPLGDEADRSYQKILLFDSGILLRLLNMSLGSVRQVTGEILTASETDLVNKGKISEMIAGLEIIKNKPSNLRHELYYWTREEKNSQSEVDYLEPFDARVLPIEVKAETQGGMKSLWNFMREKDLSYAVRCSLENFGQFDYEDKMGEEAIRHVDIIPLYAIAQMPFFQTE